MRWKTTRRVQLVGGMIISAAALAIVPIASGGQGGGGGQGANPATPAASKTPYLLRAALANGVLQKGKGKALVRANVFVWMGRDVPKHGRVEFNGGNVRSELGSATIATFSCDGNQAVITGSGLVNGRPVDFQVTLVDGGSGLANPGDRFTIDWPRFHFSNSFVTGKAWVKCPAAEDQAPAPSAPSAPSP